MPVHVAILLPKYLRMILSGHKTIESRLTQTARAPFRAIHSGERIFFKASSGPFMATAVAEHVAFFENLNAAQVKQLRDQFNDAVCGEDDYWQKKLNSNYATLIHLRDVHAVNVGPRMEPSRGPAWFVLPNKVAPAVFAITLADGAIRNRYVTIPRRTHSFPAACYGGTTARDAGKKITFALAGGDSIQSDLNPNGMVRSRTWSGFFATHDVKPGDQLCFVELGPLRYGVSVRHA